MCVLEQLFIHSLRHINQNSIFGIKHILHMKKFFTSIVAVFAFMASFATDYNGKFSSNNLSMEVKTQNGVITGTLTKNGKTFLLDGKNDGQGVAHMLITNTDKSQVGHCTIELDASGKLSS